MNDEASAFSIVQIHRDYLLPVWNSVFNGSMTVDTYCFIFATLFLPVSTPYQLPIAIFSYTIFHYGYSSLR
ncbi:MAG: hypothetical protein K2X63_10985, partial [Burkholderiaceae bacterium]|nr:hypothetical protein [Burkholderiaceae bacterium]